MIFGVVASGGDRIAPVEFRNRFLGPRPWLVLLAAGAAARASAEGRLEGPRGGASLAAGAIIEVRWEIPCGEDPAAEEAELVLSLDGGMTFPIRVSPELTACRDAFRWRVPALPSGRARLALRSGSGEASDDERLTLVSEEFTIVTGDAETSEPLMRGAREWWTAQALDGDGIEELPAPKMARDDERVVAAAPARDISRPGSPGRIETPPAASPEVVVPAKEIRPAARPESNRSATPLPLRL